MTAERRTVAFLGLGHLGGPVCDALIASPHDVVVCDPREEAVVPRVAAGARRADHPADAASTADVVIVFVRDDAQALDAVTGPQGVLRTARPGTIVVVHSTVAPGTVRVLHSACSAASVAFVDAGVSTGGGRATNRLYLMCGGDPAVIDALGPVVSVYAADVVRFGDVGAGMKAKLVRNAMRYALYAVQYEGFALAEAAGLDLAAMAHLYRSTFATSSDDEVVLSRPTMALRPMPADTVGDPLAAAVTLGWKDLDDAFELAEEVGMATPMASAAKPLYAHALGFDVADSVKGADEGGSR